MPKQRDPRVEAIAAKLVEIQPYGKDFRKTEPSVADYHAALIAVRVLDAMAEDSGPKPAHIAVGCEVRTRSGTYPSIPYVKQEDGSWKPKYEYHKTGEVEEHDS